MANVLERQSCGDWDYELIEAAGDYLVVWIGQEPAYDESGRLVCPIEPADVGLSGDKTGAIRFATEAEARAYFANVMGALKV